MANNIIPFWHLFQRQQGAKSTFGFKPKSPETGPCVICGGTFEMFGCNPEPVRPLSEGMGCHDCDATVVRAMRSRQAAVAERAEVAK